MLELKLIVVVRSYMATFQSALLLNDERLDCRAVTTNLFTRCILSFKRYFSGCDLFSTIEGRLLSHVPILSNGIHMDAILAMAKQYEMCDLTHMVEFNFNSNFLVRYDKCMKMPVI